MILPEDRHGKLQKRHRDGLFTLHGTGTTGGAGNGIGAVGYCPGPGPLQCEYTIRRVQTSVISTAGQWLTNLVCVGTVCRYCVDLG